MKAMNNHAYDDLSELRELHPCFRLTHLVDCPEFVVLRSFSASVRRGVDSALRILLQLHTELRKTNISSEHRRGVVVSPCKKHRHMKFEDTCRELSMKNIDHFTDNMLFETGFSFRSELRANDVFSCSSNVPKEMIFSDRITIPDPRWK